MAICIRNLKDVWSHVRLPYEAGLEHSVSRNRQRWDRRELSWVRLCHGLDIRKRFRKTMGMCIEHWVRKCEQDHKFQRFCSPGHCLQEILTLEASSWTTLRRKLRGNSWKRQELGIRLPRFPSQPTLPLCNPGQVAYTLSVSPFPMYKMTSVLPHRAKPWEGEYMKHSEPWLISLCKLIFHPNRHFSWNVWIFHCENSSNSWEWWATGSRFVTCSHPSGNCCK